MDQLSNAECSIAIQASGKGSLKNWRREIQNGKI
jgi:hypothetical protein